MLYIKSAYEMLANSTSSNIYSMLQKSYKDLCKDILKCDIVLLGLSPYAKMMLNTLLALNMPPRQLTIIDTICCSDLFYEGIKVQSVDYLERCSSNSLFIICTNPYSGYYANLCIKLGLQKVITCHHLSVCDNRFDFPLERYNRNIFMSKLNFILENKHFFVKFLGDLGDEESKINLSKWILYHLTFKKEYCTANAISPPYFGQTIIGHEKYRVFADLGGYSGDTLQSFLALGIDFDEYWFFEPDVDLYNDALKISNDKRIRYKNMAISNNIGIGSYMKTPDKSTTGTLVSNDAAETIPIQLDTIDNISKNELIGNAFTTIKMDIEGSEADALQGAEQMIKTYGPALMVSVEHKADDIKILSEQILSYRDDYKFFLRCGMNSVFTDLTMYAIAK